MLEWKYALKKHTFRHNIFQDIASCKTRASFKHSCTAYRAEVGNIFSCRLIMKDFLRSFSPFCDSVAAVVSFRRSTWPHYVDWAVKPQHKQTLVITAFFRHSHFLAWYKCNVNKKYLLICAPNEDSNQPAHPYSLIRAFVVRLKKLGCPKCVQWRFWKLNVFHKSCNKNMFPLPPTPTPAPAPALPHPYPPLDPSCPLVEIFPWYVYLRICMNGNLDHSGVRNIFWRWWGTGRSGGKHFYSEPFKFIFRIQIYSKVSIPEDQTYLGDSRFFVMQLNQTYFICELCTFPYLMVTWVSEQPKVS